MIQNVHSVYEQPSVYNQGGSGGGVVTELPDAAINGKLYKDLFPICTYSDGDLIDSQLILLSDISYHDPFLIMRGGAFTLSSTDTFEVQFTVRKPSFPTGNYYTTVFGSVNNYYNNITMDFGNVYDGNKHCFFGVPRSDSPSAWTTPLSLSDLHLSGNTWYTIKVVCDDSKITLYMTDDEGDKSVYVNKTNLSANSPLQLKGVNRDSNKRFAGQIDLKKSYIKKNGVLVWGIES